MANRSIRIITWNVWFGEYERRTRQRALWSQLEAHDPDVVCLQEMVPDHLSGPEVERWRDRGYWVSDDHIFGYDVVMLSRLPVRSHERRPQVSMMGRELLVARLGTEPPLTVATIHLESTAPMTDARVLQLTNINEHLAGQTDVVLVGDMNFSDDDPQETAKVADWQDAWLHLRPGEPGFTVDSHVNQMRYLSKGRHVQKRIDRVFFRGERWRLHRIERLGTEPLSEDPLTFVSDHFGLMAELVLA